MSSASPGHVNTPGDPEDGLGATPGTASATARAGTTPVRAPTQKRARATPDSPARARALAVFNTITDSVRAGAVRGLRAITDSIERPRDGILSPGSSDSGPPSPTTAVRAAAFTPEGKKRRTVLTDAIARRSHADWRGARWDYSSAMRDSNLFRVGDTGPSLFAFPEGRPTAGDGPGGTQQGQADDDPPGTPPRPPSAMSAASAPAVMTTPRSQRHQTAREGPPERQTSDEGWIVAVEQPDFDPFAIATGEPCDLMAMDSPTGVGDEGDERDVRFVRAVRMATALLSDETVNSPDACGALLAFQARLRMHDPYGNFAQPPAAGDSAAGEMRELRRMVEDLAAAQRACTDALSALATRDSQPAAEALKPATRDRGGAAAAAPTPVRDAPPDKSGGTEVPNKSGARGGERPAQAIAPEVASLAAPGDDRRAAPTHAVGRHDPRRAVFCPAKPFGGRITTPAPTGAVQDLNATSYVLRDAVNAALRDVLIAQMDEASDPVQVAGVNWTERGNLCMVVAEGFVAAHLLLHADVAAEAAALGAGWKASRDVPIHKAVLCNVPTRRVDGSLFSEDEILADLRAHSVTFRTVRFADSAEQASWIATANERARKKRSTLVVNLATAGDAQRFMAMRHRLYVLGCACEPGEFQPRDRDRVCRTCWNPLARHRERDFRCRARCRLCGGAHIEEDHACTACDVLARACAHIPLKCANCGRAHAADDGACEYRRRLRGTGATVPPMSSRAGGRATGSSAAAPAKERRKKRIRILEPDEPFPDDPPAGPAPAPPPLPAPAQEAVTNDGSDARTQKKGARRAKPRTGGGAHPGANATNAPQTQARAEVPQPAQASAQMEQTGAQLDPGPVADGEPSAPPAGMTAEDDLAVQDLVGGTTTPPRAASPSAAAGEGAAPTTAPSRRVAPPRAAAAEADRDGRRRRVAHALANAFGFLQLPDAIAALRRCSDDHASAVSWAADTQASRRKPGMQGKNAESLRKVVAAMDAAAATYKPAKDTDPAPPPADA